jgi:glycosyltransferase involved in cell wall biosynthesis
MKLLPSEIILHIVGDGPMEDELKNLTVENGLSDRVIFLGYRTREEIYEYLQKADCFVLSSLHEGLGIVVQEAMYAGLPIVSTNNGGQTDLIKRPRNGLLVEPNDIEKLANAIHKFYSDRDLAEVVGKNNKEDIKNYYMTVNCELYIDLFKELVGLTSGNDVPNWEAPKRAKGPT